jgi:hypothetical protein
MDSKTTLRQALIVPNRSAAGVEIGATKESVKELWGEPLGLERRADDSEVWKYRGVSFWFKSNRIHQIGVRGSYAGKTKEGIGIGSTRAEVEDVFGYLEWDGTWLINRPPFGIGFDFDPALINRPVTDIFVFKE